MISSPATSELLTISGPAGVLEALLEQPAAGSPAAVAAICHPHPLHGGTMHNKVVHTLARALQQLGSVTLRFNYRGVGASGGSFADGLGETLDTLAVVEYLRQRFPSLPLTLAGFSFGGAVALRAAQTAAPARLVTVAPAVDRVPVAGLRRPAGDWLIVQGQMDDVVDAGRVQRWAASFVPPPQLELLPGVGHFFHGALGQLRDRVLAFASPQKRPDA